MRLLRRIWEWIEHTDAAASVVQAVGLWKPLAALLAAVVAAVSGALASLPIAYLIPAVALSFFGVLGMINQFEVWRERSRTAGLLSMNRIISRCGVETGYPDPAVANYQPGILLKNHARHPIHYKVGRMTAVVGGKTVARPKFSSLGGVIPPGDTNQFYFATIPGVPTDSAPTGFIEFDITYGPSERRKPFKLKQAYELRFGWTSQDKTKPPDHIDYIAVDQRGDTD